MLNSENPDQKIWKSMQANNITFLFNIIEYEALQDCEDQKRLEDEM